MENKKKQPAVVFDTNALNKKRTLINGKTGQVVAEGDDVAQAIRNKQK